MLDQLQVFLLAMTPIGELRAGITAGLLVFKMSWWSSYFWAVSGNMFVVLLLLLLLQPVMSFLKQNFPRLGAILEHWSVRTDKHYAPLVRRYGYAVLVLLAAMPLPLVGGWTAALAAILFNIPLRLAFGLITLGLLIAGVLVILLVQGGLVLAS